MDERGIESSEAWDIFKLAAKQGDPDLAKLAIAHFDEAGVRPREWFAQKPPSFFDDVPSRYVFALLRCFVNPNILVGTFLEKTVPAIIFQSSDTAASAFQPE
jgi:hypothetical protein